MTPVLEFDSIHFTYPGQAQPALRGASLRVPRGVRACVVGHNGSGKSTLFLHANGILRPQRGVVRYAGQSVVYDKKGLRQLRQGVGIVFQNPDDQLFSANVAQDISFGPLNLGLNETEARRRVELAAEMAEVTALLDRPTYALSGGEKARVALAGVIAIDPEVLLVDELTASLDPRMRRQVFAVFHRLVERGKTVLLATHDTAVARYWPDLLVVMDAGRVLAAGEPGTVLADGRVREILVEEPWLEAQPVPVAGQPEDRPNGEALGEAAALLDEQR